MTTDELLTTLQRATKGTAELDADVCAWLLAEHHIDVKNAKSPTQSLDHVKAIVPKGAKWSMAGADGEKGYAAIWDDKRIEDKYPTRDVIAATPAIALCICIVKLLEMRAERYRRAG